MLKNFITSINLIGPFGEISNEQLREWKKGYKGAIGRRMTTLALLVGEAISPYAFAQEDRLIYATTFSEVRSLESCLASFPSTSPLHFQNSIHPSGLLQVLVSRQQPIACIIPLASKDFLVYDALHSAMSSSADQTYVIGGEEISPWLTPLGEASEESFAFAMRLSKEADGHALGTLEWQEHAPDDGVSPIAQISLQAFIMAMDKREHMHLFHRDYGYFKIQFMA